MDANTSTKCWSRIVIDTFSYPSEKENNIIDCMPKDEPDSWIANPPLHVLLLNDIHVLFCYDIIEIMN